MAEQSMIFIGIRGTALALDPSSGSEVWRAVLKGGDFVNVSLVEGTVYAATKGELFALDPATGQILWHNTLKGLGTGFVTMAGSAQVPPAMASRRRQQQQAAAAAAAAT